MAKFHKESPVIMPLMEAIRDTLPLSHGLFPAGALLPLRRRARGPRALPHLLCRPLALLVPLRRPPRTGSRPRRRPMPGVRQRGETLRPSPAARTPRDPLPHHRLPRLPCLPAPLPSGPRPGTAAAGGPLAGAAPRLAAAAVARTPGICGGCRGMSATALAVAPALRLGTAESAGAGQRFLAALTQRLCAGPRRFP